MVKSRSYTGQSEILRDWPFLTGDCLRVLAPYDPSDPFSVAYLYCPLVREQEPLAVNSSRRLPRENVGGGLCRLGKRLLFDRLDDRDEASRLAGMTFEQSFKFRAQPIATLGRERVKR